MEYILGLIILSIGLIYLICKRSKMFLHMVQLEGYNSDNFKKWIRNNKERAYKLGKDDSPVKKPLVFTQRATRLFRTNAIISSAFLLAAILYYILSPSIWAFILVPV